MSSIIEKSNDPDNIRIAEENEESKEGRTSDFSNVVKLSNVRSVHILESSWNHSNMYQAISRGIKSTHHEDVVREESSEEPEMCSICYEDINIPYRLDCRHRFCYLCIKRAYESNQECPYCRTPITERIDEDVSLQDKVLTLTDYQWLYSGKQFGWWEFDPRTNQQLESSFQRGELNDTIYIMGRPYMIDFQQMEQRSSDSRGVRKLKRVDRKRSDDLVKGMAGLRFETEG